MNEVNVPAMIYDSSAPLLEFTIPGNSHFCSFMADDAALHRRIMNSCKSMLISHTP